MNWRHCVHSTLGLGERMVRGPVSLDARALSQLDSFLVLFYDNMALGVAIHATPLFEALRSAYPGATIVAATQGITAEIIGHNPCIDRIVLTADPYRHPIAAARMLRKVYDSTEPKCIITAAGSSRTRIALLAMSAGKAVRAGYTLAPGLYHLPASVAFGTSSLIDRTLHALDSLGVPFQTREPRIYFSQSALERARGLLGGEGGSFRPRAILITRTSDKQPTQWLEERFVKVARHLIERHGFRIVLTGTKSDGPHLEALRDHIGEQTLSLAGMTTISEMAAVCTQVDLAVTLDTGGLHVARTQMLPSVVIAPAWQSSLEWLPIDQPWARILKGPAFPPPAPQDYRMQEISVEQVIEQTEELLREYPPSTGAREQRVQRSMVRTEQARSA